MRFFENLAADVRYALRSFGSSPGFTAAAIAAIAVGIGINTGLFTVLNGLVLREVAAPDPAELVSIYQIIEAESRARPRSVNGTKSMFSFSEYETYRDSTRTLSGVLAYNLSELGATLGGPAPRDSQGTLVSCNYFEVLRVPPAVGRSFPAETCENRAGPPEVVLAHEVWLTSFRRKHA